MELDKFLLECGAVKFGDFTLASGRKSKFYVDIKKASTSPEFLKETAIRMKGVMPECDLIAGVELGAVPLAVALSLETGIPYRIIRKPLLTEKGYDIKEKHNQVAFQVEKDANKVQIKKAVEEIFKVKVKKVNVMNRAGKKKRLGRNMGRRADWKKAVVTLMPGENIEIIEGTS